MAFVQKSAKVNPPIRGSFPIDHDGECKAFITKYMNCLRKHHMANTECREESKKYFECRMDNELMARDDWDTLGYGKRQEPSVKMKAENSKT